MPRTKSAPKPAKEAPAAATPQLTPGERLQFECRAVKLSFSEMGRQKTLSEEHKAEIATSLGATQSSLALSKRLFDSQEPTIKAVNAAKSAIHGYWLGMTLPYTEAGTRLIKEDGIDRFSSHVDELIVGFRDAVDKLDAALAGIIERERTRLGRAFNSADYPATVKNLFNVEISYPNTSPPEYLRKLKPDLYDRELQRIRAQFDQAALLAETDMLNEFQGVVEQLVASLQNVTSGKQKTFRSSTVDGLFRVFDTFQNKLAPFKIGTEGRLQELIEQAKQAVGGSPIDLLPDNLRRSAQFRDQVANAMQQVSQELTKCIDEKTAPRRNVSRSDTV